MRVCARVCACARVYVCVCEHPNKGVPSQCDQWTHTHFVLMPKTTRQRETEIQREKMREKERERKEKQKEKEKEAKV